MLYKTILSLITFTALVHAGVFSLDVVNTTSSQSFTNDFSSVEDTFNALDADQIKSQINYKETDAINAVVNFRGLPMTLDYVLDSTTLILNIPSIGITETFSGTTRDNSVDMLSDWLKTNGGAVVEKIMKKLAEVSAVDPIAGNPNSLMGLSVSNDFTTGFMNVATQQTSTQASVSAVNKNAIIIAPTYSSFDADGIKSESYILPLAYSFSFDRDSRENITLSLPITYTEVEGAKSGSLSLGLSYSKPIADSWVLTPSISYGASGSVDLGALAQIVSTSITSSYSWNLTEDYILSMGNMVGYYTTVKLYDGDYAYNPGIQNIVYRNALMLNIPTNFLMKKTSLETFIIDTRYTGTALYMNQYQEYGISYGYDAVNLNILSDNEQYRIRKSLKVGVSYLDSNKGKGFKVNFGFVF